MSATRPLRTAAQSAPFRRRAQVQQVTGGHQSDADDRQHRFLDAMLDREAAAHEAEAHHRHHERRGAAVLDRADPDRDSSDQRGQEQADAMDHRIEQQPAAESEAGDDDDAEHAMHCAQARQEHAGAVEPPANRGKYETHGRPSM